MRLASTTIVLAACGSGDPALDARGELHAGLVEIGSQRFTADGTDYETGFAAVTLFTPTVCPGSRVGDCILYTCITPAPPVTPHSAGTISVTGATRPISLAPLPTKVYETYRTGALFTGEEELRATASGADIAAFTAAVTAPSRVTITSPAPPLDDDPLAIDVHTPFRVTWTGGASGLVELQFSGPDAATLTCSFPANAGVAEVPASSLITVSRGLGQFSARSMATTPVEAGDWRIELRATQAAVWSDSRIATDAAAVFD